MTPKQDQLQPAGFDRLKSQSQRFKLCHALWAAGIKVTSLTAAWKGNSCLNEVLCQGQHGVP